MAGPRAVSGEFDVSTIIARWNRAGYPADGLLALNTTRTNQLTEASILDDGRVPFWRPVPVGKAWRRSSGPSR
jgi:hypothetical protein